MTQLEILRRMRHWSRNELAKAAGVSSDSARRAEHGIAVRVETLEKLASAVGVTVPDIAPNHRTCKRAS